MIHVVELSHRECALILVALEKRSEWCGEWSYRSRKDGFPADAAAYAREMGELDALRSRLEKESNA